MAQVGEGRQSYAHRRRTGETQMSARKGDDVFSGVLIALGIVYSMDSDPTATLAQEIVGACSPRDLLRVAKAENDCYLPLLRRTVRSLEKRK